MIFWNSRFPCLLILLAILAALTILALDPADIKARTPHSNRIAMRYAIGTMHAFLAVSVEWLFWSTRLTRRLRFEIPCGAFLLLCVGLHIADADPYDPGIMFVAAAASLISQVVLLVGFEIDRLRFMPKELTPPHFRVNDSQFTLREVAMLTACVAVLFAIARVTLVTRSELLVSIATIFAIDSLAVTPYLILIVVLGSENFSSIVVRLLFRSPLFFLSSLTFFVAGEKSLSAVTLDVTVVIWTLLYASAIRSSGLRLVCGETNLRDPFTSPE